MTLQFKILTLNCWGLPIVSKNRSARITAIAESLATSNYDAVCLQEVWLNKDFELIRNKASGAYPFAHYFYSGVTGSGVCILSKHPIEDVFFHQWSVNGYMHKLHHGDWFGGKGVGLCRLRVDNFIINVYSAHLHAEYDRDRDEYLAHRILQAYDTAQFIMLTSRDADLVILAGDLNTEPGDLAYRLMLSVPGLIDAYVEFDETPEDLTATNESINNSYTPKSLRNSGICGKRIDYILYHSGTNTEVSLKNYCLPLPDRVPYCNFSYSDHEAVAATFELKSGKKHDFIDPEKKKYDLEESVSLCDKQLKKLVKHKLIYCFLTFVLFILLLVTLVTDAPWEANIVYIILQILITCLMVFTILMATIWNKIERHAVIANKLAMEVNLRQLRNKY